MEYRPKEVVCHACGGKATQIISPRDTTPVDAAWISSVLEVVDKDPEAPAHCKEFLRHPTRANYKAWMAGEGLRPMDKAEKGGVKKPTEAEEKFRKDTVKRKVCEGLMEREKIEI